MSQSRNTQDTELRLISHAPQLRNNLAQCEGDALLSGMSHTAESNVWITYNRLELY